MFTVSLFRIDLNKYSDCDVQRQLELTHMLLECRERFFNENGYYFNTAGDELLVGAVTGIVPLRNIVQGISLMQLFLNQENIKFKSSLVLCDGLEAHNNNLSDVKSFTKNNCGYIYFAGKEKFNEDIAYNLGDFAGYPLILSARLLEISKALKQHYYKTTVGCFINNRHTLGELSYLTVGLRPIKIDSFGDSVSQKVTDNLSKYSRDFNLEVFECSLQMDGLRVD